MPSNASSGDQLISKSNVPYINQTITNVANVESFGASLQAYGARSLAGKASINGQWYDYISSIQGNTASGGSWVGNAILWGNNGDFYTLRKGYSTSTTWVISKHVKTSDLTSTIGSKNCDNIKFGSNDKLFYQVSGKVVVVYANNITTIASVNGNIASGFPIPIEATYGLMFDSDGVPYKFTINTNTAISSVIPSGKTISGQLVYIAQ